MRKSHPFRAAITDAFIVSRASRLIFRHIFLCPPASITYWWHYRSIDSKEYWHGSQSEQGTKAFDPQGPQADEGSHPPERAAESGGDGLWTHALWSGGAGRQTPHVPADAIPRLLAGLADRTPSYLVRPGFHANTPLNQSNDNATNMLYSLADAKKCDER